MRWLLMLLLWLTLRTLRRRRRAIHDADGVRRICALRGGAGIFQGFRWRRRLHRVGVLVLCEAGAVVAAAAEGRAGSSLHGARAFAESSRWLCGIERRHTG
ncbi:hypothetical protein B0H14DRAFT_2999860 [Mycena olivaceomarginata]|nr:hypothetical protein B0H14DRAFT_2999860 [Mycena olivaceomarginata]